MKLPKIESAAAVPGVENPSSAAPAEAPEAASGEAPVPKSRACASVAGDAAGPTAYAAEVA